MYGYIADKEITDRVREAKRQIRKEKGKFLNWYMSLEHLDQRQIDLRVRFEDSAGAIRACIFPFTWK